MGGMDNYNQNHVNINPEDRINTLINFDMPDADAEGDTDDDADVDADPVVAAVPVAAPALPAAADPPLVPYPAAAPAFDNPDAADAGDAGLYNFPLAAPGHAANNPNNPIFNGPIFVPGTGYVNITPGNGLINHMVPEEERANRANLEPYLGPLGTTLYSSASATKSTSSPPRVPGDNAFFVALCQDYWQQPAKAARRAVMADDENGQTRHNAGAVWRTGVAEVAWEAYKGSGPNGVSPFAPLPVAAAEGGSSPKGDVVVPGASAPGASVPGVVAPGVAASPLGVVAPTAVASGAVNNNLGNIDNLGHVGGHHQHHHNNDNFWGLGNLNNIPAPAQHHQQ
ncbi:hypothetical protein B0J18DRAFT_457167 [Chaetomium sp. MPI-SDFR-AT-0129]|nr:hypothetical protein B0J18DRAFT_457167 [Chaetomium sp. MPI-SDFR-AT-0129]